MSDNEADSSMPSETNDGCNSQRSSTPAFVLINVDDSREASKDVDSGIIEAEPLTTDSASAAINRKYVTILKLMNLYVKSIISSTNSCITFIHSDNTLIESNVEETPIPSYLDINIDADAWEVYLQDKGCLENKLPKKRYKQAKILSVGPKNGEMVFYYYLTVIAVDFVKAMQHQMVSRIGWFKLPKNLPNVKSKIVEVIIQLRVFDGNKYTLEQTRLINFLHGIWGTDSASLGMHDNDKVRLFGLIMSIEENRPQFQRLAEGAKV